MTYIEKKILDRSPISIGLSNNGWVKRDMSPEISAEAKEIVEKIMNENKK